MNRFEFSNRLRIVLSIGIVIGIISLFVGYFAAGDDYHSQFWSDVLLNNTYFLGISLMALFTLSAFIISWAGWYVVFKRLLEAFSVFLFTGAIIMLLIALGNYFGWHYLYLWADEPIVANDSVIQAKSPFLNKNVFLFATVFATGIWMFWRIALRKLSLLEDIGVKGDYSLHKKSRIWAATFLPVFGITSAIVIWLWIMSIEVHWYSTMFAWYIASGWFVAMISLLIVVLIFLKSKGYFELVSKEHIHDLGKFLFAFSIFWAYLYYDQYMLIWFGNLGEETSHFKLQQYHYTVIFYLILVLNFVVPLLGLMINTAKRTNWVLITVSVLTFVGHWLDYWINIKPYTAKVVEHLYQVNEIDFQVNISHYPNLVDVGVMTGFLCLFLYVTLRSLSKANLISVNDPYLEESVGHEVF